MLTFDIGDAGGDDVITALFAAGHNGGNAGSVTCETTDVAGEVVVCGNGLNGEEIVVMLCGIGALGLGQNNSNDVRRKERKGDD